MKSAALSINTRYSSYNDVTFVVLNWGVVTLQGSAEGRSFPASWQVYVGSHDYGMCDLGELRKLTLRGRAIDKMLRALKAGRI